MNYIYKINGRVNEATAYTPPTIKFNLNVMFTGWQYIDKQTKNRHFNIENFIAYMVAIELHEIGHIYNYDIGCNKEDHIDSNTCGWCNEIKNIYNWLK